MQPELAEALKDIVGPDNYSHDLMDLVAGQGDASPHQNRPEAIVWPTGTKQVSQVLKLASRHRLPVTTRGAGTGICGAAVPAAGGLVLDMCRMNRILEINIPDRLVRVEPGVIYADLQKELAPKGFFFPPDPGSSSVCSLGGNVATNAGGLRGAKYGATRDYVLALEVVLADGRVMSTGARTMKSASGLDLVRLFVGSEGMLGVITQVVLKISPLPGAAATMMATFDDLADAARAVRQVMSSGIIPSVMELLGRNLIKAINRDAGLGLPEVDAILLVETDGCTQAEADFQLGRIQEVFKAHKVGEISLATSEAEKAELWLARKSAYPVMARINNDIIVEDVTVPVSRLPELIEGFRQIEARHGITVGTLAHAGDGNFHPLIAFDGRRPQEAEAVHRAADELFKLALDLGGTISGEHGIGLSKLKYMPWEHSQVELEMMAAVKKVFDPLGILNPGKLGPAPPA